MLRSGVSAHAQIFTYGPIENLRKQRVTNRGQLLIYKYTLHRTELCCSRDDKQLVCKHQNWSNRKNWSIDNKVEKRKNDKSKLKSFLSPRKA